MGKTLGWAGATPNLATKGWPKCPGVAPAHKGVFPVPCRQSERLHAASFRILLTNTGNLPNEICRAKKSSMGCGGLNSTDAPFFELWAVFRLETYFVRAPCVQAETLSDKMSDSLYE